jgi:hypothetical protein
MTKLRQLELLISLQLNPKQKFLLNFQKKHLISNLDHERGREQKLQNEKEKGDISSSSSEEDLPAHKIFRKFTGNNEIMLRK